MSKTYLITIICHGWACYGEGHDLFKLVLLFFARAFACHVSEEHIKTLVQKNKKTTKKQQEQQPIEDPCKLLKRSLTGLCT